MFDNVSPIHPNVVRFETSLAPIKTLESLRWAYISVHRKAPRYLILGPFHLSLLVKAIREQGVSVSERSVTEILDMQVVRVPRDTLEFGE